ncbi:MAG: hypothetical protein GY795_14955 [Desulfobacterales bacterium]|nr:hypothetical protein [Desulfobacterales bacterium]
MKENPHLMEIEYIVETDSRIEEATFLIPLEKKIIQTLKSDISFGLGDYKLSDLSKKGQKALQTFTKNLTEIEKDYPKQYEEQLITIIIKTVGFTDETPFSERLEKELARPGDNIPEDRVEKRKFFNKRLSELRATTVNDYITKELEKFYENNEKIKIEPDIIGKGEEPPTKREGPLSYRSRDPRRRICKISAIFKREPLSLHTDFSPCFQNQSGLLQ